MKLQEFPKITRHFFKCLISVINCDKYLGEKKYLPGLDIVPGTLGLISHCDAAESK
jgi:hypothetical protein